MLIQPVLRPVLQPVLRSVFGASGGGTPSLTAQVQALFAKYSAAGGMWDFTDMGTLFQDSARTVPVTAASQPVGGVNDISGLHSVLAQPTNAARPQFNGAGVTPDGVDDFLVTASNLDLSACDKVVVGMGYTKASYSAKMMMEFGDLGYTLRKFNLVQGDGPGGFQYPGGASPSAANQAVLASNPPIDQYGAHIGRGSIPGDLAQVWWNGVKGIDSTTDRVGGTLDNQPLYLMSRVGTSLFSDFPTRRAFVMGVPVANSQVSDDDIELIRLWLMEGA